MKGRRGERGIRRRTEPIKVPPSSIYPFAASPIPIILASSSPRRSDLLRQIGIEPVVVPSHVTEVIKENEAPEDAALRLAAEKAMEVAGQFKEGLVVGADTIVVIDGEQLGKPEDREDARRMLRLLSGRSHTVITGMAVIDAGTSERRTTLVRTTVRFKEISGEEIDSYIATGDPMDKAGAYGIQGRAAAFIDGIEGCYSNVVGLPLSELAEMLKSFGWKI